jgi:hypothetical protein
MCGYWQCSYKYIIVGGGNAAGYAAKEFKEHGVGDVRQKPLEAIVLPLAVLSSKAVHV